MASTSNASSRTVPVHWLRANEKVWTPPAVIFWDTETIDTESTEAGATMTMRLWYAQYHMRREDHGRRLRMEEAHGTGAHELAVWVDSVVPPGCTTYLFAHNLGFDIAVSALPNRLAELGWTISDCSVHTNTPWFKLRKNRQRLVLVDSYSYLPEGLQEIGWKVDIEKLDLPDGRDPSPEWLQRCRVDVQILGCAIRELLDWWDKNQLGRFTITGPAAAWNAFRHVGMERRILIDPDPERRAFEREAIYGGHREAFYVGAREGGPFEELDIEHAYLTIMKTRSLPFKMRRHAGAISLDQYRIDRRHGQFVARVRVTRAQGLAPVRVDGMVAYPQGECETTLCSPEIDLLLERDAGVEILDSYYYLTYPFLRRFATMLEDWLNAPHSVAPLVLHPMFKHWSRTIGGKWAARSSTTRVIGPALTPGWDYRAGVNRTTGARTSIVQIAGQAFENTHDAEPDNAFPAVLAFIESNLRVALLTLLEQIPTSALITTNTDGLIVDRSRSNVTPDTAALGPHWKLRSKKRYEQVEVAGPQHLWLGGEHRLSGISRKAKDLGNHEYDVLVWPKLRTQMRIGDPGEYRLRRQRTKIVGPFTNRWVLADGSTVPLWTEIIDGATRIVEWNRTIHSLAGLELAEAQHPILAARIHVAVDAGARAPPAAQPRLF